MSKLYNIKNWTRQNLRAWMVENTETLSKMQALRADQVFYWLYRQKVESFAEMLNISQETKKMLEEHFWISSMKIAESQKSQDGSIKYRLLLEDGYSIECVFMPHTNHNTVCVSSQVGCGMGCDFCMTGTMGLVRNLKTAEIIDQILTVWGDLPDEQNLRNIVFMGMGEPFHNYKNLLQALEILTDKHGFNFSQRRITVSTSGLLPKIRRFGKERIKTNLAISLNGVTDDVRSKLMPINKAYNLEELIKVCRDKPC
jgi:23S rRNA (adenine2503-C2)-methyltransferase